MQSKTIVENDKNELIKLLNKAAEEDNPEAASEAYKAFFGKIEQKVLQEAKEAANEIAEGYTAEIALAKRGVQILTPGEEKYFKGFIEAAKDYNLTDYTEAIPTTYIDRVFEGLKKRHKILNHVRFENTGILTRFIYNASTSGAAAWGELNSAIVEEILGGFKSIDLNLAKLSAFMVISNDMLDLGPAWVEKYSRECLIEAASLGLEKGITNGKGVKGEPIGMKKNLAAARDDTTGYPDKEAIAITDFSPETMGDLLARMSVTPEGDDREIAKVFVTAKPTTFYKKILPAITMLSPMGQYIQAVPFPTEFFPTSGGLAENEAIIGIDEEGYLMALGSGKKGKIEKSKEALFLEDCTALKIKLNGAGQAKDNNCFLLLDVSGLEPLALRIHNDVAEEG